MPRLQAAPWKLFSASTPPFLDSSFPSLLGAVASHSSALSPWSTLNTMEQGKGQGRASNHSSCSGGAERPPLLGEATKLEDVSWVGPGGQHPWESELEGPPLGVWLIPGGGMVVRG